MRMLMIWLVTLAVGFGLALLLIPTVGILWGLAKTWLDRI